MGKIEVLSRTQRIIVGPKQSITVTNNGPVVQNSSVRIVNAGPIGPPGGQGLQGLPGVDAETSVELVMEEHIDSSLPHPIYDDMVDLTIHLENGLF